MAYNAKLETMIDSAVKGWKDVRKKKLFGGVCWLVKSNMAFGIWKDSLIVRLDAAEGERRLKEKNVEPFAVTGRPMRGWIMVNEAGWKTTAGLAKWIDRGKAFALSLPEKKQKVRPNKKTLREFRG